MCYEVILQGYGWQRGWMVSTLMGANVKSFPASSSAIPRAVGAGDLAFGLAIDFYAWSEVSARGADKIGYVMPEGLTVVNPDSIAILKGAPHLELAKRFVSFVMSKQGQKLWMLPKGDPEGPKNNLLGRMCVIPELYDELQGRTVVPFNPFKMKTSLQYNATKGSIRYTILNDLIRALIIDSHEDLVAAWSTIISTNETLTRAGITSQRINEAINRLCEVPVTEAKIEQLSANWSNPQFRNRYINEWHAFAKQKYADAIELAKSAGIDLVTSFQNQIAQLKNTAQNNLYMGLGGGLIIGLLIGLALSIFLARRREIAAVKK
jgi:spermidine/putrescine-binding protein